MYIYRRTQFIGVCSYITYTGVTEYIETGLGGEDTLSGLETQTFSEEDVRTLFAGVLCLLTAALRTPKLKSGVSFFLGKSWRLAAMGAKVKLLNNGHVLTNLCIIDMLFCSL